MVWWKAARQSVEGGQWRDKVGFVRIGWQGGVFVVSEQEVGVQGVQRTTGYFTRVNCKVRSEFKSESSKVGCE